MDFDYTPEQQKFRTATRTWLETTAAELFGDVVDPSHSSIEGLLYTRDDRLWQRMLEYHRRLHAAGYLALHWPKPKSSATLSASAYSACPRADRNRDGIR